jgi:hypothetical protein
MAHHIGVTSTYGVTLPAGAIAQNASKSQNVDVSEVPGDDGEIALASPLRANKVDVSVSGVGPAGLDAVTAGNVALPATMTILSVEQGEKSSGDNRATFSINATGMEAFTETAVGTPDAAGAGDPDEETLGIVGITMSLSETYSERREVNDVNAPATNGAPGARAKCNVRSSFSVRGKGDKSAALTMGIDGIAPAGISTGKTIVRQLVENQAAQELNGWGAEAMNYPAAA